MKVFLDFLPIVLFFLTYKSAEKIRGFLANYLPENASAWLAEQSDFILATLVLIPATLIPVLYTWFKERRLHKSHLFTFVIVLVMGLLTISFNNPDFLKWKPTIVSWAFAAIFLITMLVSEKSLLQRMIGDEISLPDIAWQRLNIAWIVFFIISGAINLGVAYNFSEDIWVDFKLFGMLGITLVFIFLQGIYLSRYINTTD